MEELKRVRDGIYEKRGATQPLSKQLQQGKQRLKSTPLRKSKESPPTSLEKAVMSRRPVVEPSDDEEAFPEQDWETEGSGKLINQLYVSLGTITGNSSSYEKRRATQPLSKQLQQGKQRLKSTPLRKSKESPPTSLEKAVMSRRPVVEPSDDEEDFPEQDWETEGSGKLINQLYVSLGTITGNSSIKLRYFLCLIH